MKMVEAVINPFKLEDVKSVLARLGIQRITALEVRGFGCHKGFIATRRGSGHTRYLLPRIRFRSDVVLGNVQMVPGLGRDSSTCRSLQDRRREDFCEFRSGCHLDLSRETGECVNGEVEYSA